MVFELYYNAQLKLNTMKYLIKYTNQYTNEVAYIEVDSMVEFAVKYLDFEIKWNEDVIYGNFESGGWDVFLMGKDVAHYTKEWTREEVLKNYFIDFERKNNWKNIEYYVKI